MSVNEKSLYFLLELGRCQVVDELAHDLFLRHGVAVAKLRQLVEPGNAVHEMVHRLVGIHRGRMEILAKLLGASGRSVAGGDEVKTLFKGFAVCRGFGHYEQVDIFMNMIVNESAGRFGTTIRSLHVATNFGYPVINTVITLTTERRRFGDIPITCFVESEGFERLDKLLVELAGFISCLYGLLMEVWG